MSILRRIISGEEAKIKGDDDHLIKQAGRNYFAKIPWAAPIRFRRRRTVPSIIAIILLYVFFRNIPTDISPASTRLRPNMSPGTQPPAPAALETSPGTHPPRAEGALSDESKHYFDGPIKYYKLAISLHGIAKTEGHRLRNRNVLFAVANLQSASVMIPIACEMARWSRNYVHFAFMGRDDIAIEDILRVNGVGLECEVYWHDGRPDYSQYSSDFRMRSSVLAGLKYVDDFMHPQAIITDNSGQEDAFFTSAIREKTGALHRTLIELPGNAVENLMWLTRLDSGSLRGERIQIIRVEVQDTKRSSIAWSSTEVDILIHASQGASGSLIRLLRSIESADYFGSKLPRLVIDLPSSIESPIRQYLENLVWPPIQPNNPNLMNQVILRHRINHGGISVEEASIKFIESFYPTSSVNSHVLVLSPQVELSPLYFHYLKYNLLEYKYSTYGSLDSRDLVGIGLVMPTKQLNDSEPFLIPPVERLIGVEDERKDSGITSFLWQAPNSNAALYFGEKWVEYHDFLSNRLEVQRSIPHLGGEQVKHGKIVSETYPSWMEYFLELIRARGYFMLFPGSDNIETVAKVHAELYTLPEEFVNIPQQDESGEMKGNASTDPLIADSAPFALPSHPIEPSLISQPLLSILPNEGDLPELPNMPRFSYDGRRVSSSENALDSDVFKNSFRRSIGACSRAYQGRVQATSTADLFCLDNAEHRQGHGREEESDEGFQSNGTIARSLDATTDPDPAFRNVTSSSPGPVLPAITSGFTDIASSVHKTDQISVSLP